MNNYTVGFVAIVALAASSPAAAGTILSNLPPPPSSAGLTSLTNKAAAQNFLVKFTLDEDVLVDGFTIMTNKAFGGIGQAVVIKYANAFGDEPGAITSLSSVIDESSAFGAQNKLVSAHFGPISFVAGTYYFGMSGANAELAWSADGDNLPGTGRQFQGDAATPLVARYGLAWELLGSAASVGSVPEPRTWALLLGGFGLVGASLRYRRTRTAI